MATTLVKVKFQTNTLQKLIGTQIRQLTRAVTSQSPTEEALLGALLQAASTSNIAASIQTPAAGADVTTLRREVIAAYMGHLGAGASSASRFSIQGRPPPVRARTGGPILRAALGWRWRRAITPARWATSAGGSSTARPIPSE